MTISYKLPLDKETQTKLEDEYNTHITKKGLISAIYKKFFHSIIKRKIAIMANSQNEHKFKGKYPILLASKEVQINNNHLNLF